MRLNVSVEGPAAFAAGAVLCASYLAVFAGSLALSGMPLPPFWPANALIAAGVVILPRKVLWPSLVLCLVCASALMTPYSSSPQWGFVRALLNVMEGVVAGFLARAVLGPRGLLRSTSDFLRLQFLACAPAALLTVVLGFLVRLAGRAPLVPDIWRMAFFPHLLGLATVLPAALLLTQPNASSVKRAGVESVLYFCGLAVFNYLVFYPMHFPVVFVITPLLMLGAFRLGPRGSVCGVLAGALVCLPGAVIGGGAFSLHPQWTLSDRVLIYQLTTFSSLFGVAVCSFTVAKQSRLRRLMQRRATSAREARRRAMAASRAKTDFLATMSHEIRTPMNSILGFTQLLLHDKDLPEAARERIKIIAGAGGSLMTVLNDILDFSRVEAGQIELLDEPVDPTEVAAAVVEIMRAPARAKDLALRLETDGAQGAFMLDAQRLRQILLNLLNNAVKFTEVGHVRLLAAHDAARQVLRFEVSDTGIGVDEAVIDRLFSRFSQADSSTTRQYGGSGLGLAICKGLVERMGGRIGVESRPGSGSTFWFEIPAVAASSVADAVQDNEVGFGTVSGRVLLVDDHPMNRMLGETLLGILGCTVDLAASGEEAVHAAGEQAYDLILMDVHMPGMDGLTATREIKALHPNGGGPAVIAMTADVMPQNLERCRQVGMVDHIAKPIQLPQMRAVLDRWIAEQNSRSAA